ncbi:MAG: hypothetical protein EXS13_05490 [Planctomycetes bacterium]|nr:hypothetical protein [Planctomycetota bacterium]
MSQRAEFDFDHDGWLDDVVYTRSDPWGVRNQSTVTLYSGRFGRSLFDFRTLDLYGTLGLIGWSSSSAGDQNGDGIDDLVLGDPCWNGAGYPAGRATLHLGHELFIQVNDEFYDPNDTANIRVTGGEPYHTALLAAVEFGGAPIFETVDLAPLNKYGELIYSDIVPSGFSGMTLTLQAFALRPGDGKLLVSSTDQITLR